MPPTSLSRRRTKRLFAELDRQGRAVDAVVIRNGTEPHVDLSFFYFTGVKSGIFEGAICVLLPTGAVHVLTSALEAESARQSDQGARVHVLRRAGDATTIFGRLVPKGSRIGINPPELTHSSYKKIRRLVPRAKVVDVSPDIARVRTIKEPEEIRSIGRAARISSKVAGMIPDWLRAGVKEYEVAAEIEYHQQKLGGSGASFATISAFGKNAAEPHYTQNRATLRGNKFCLFDYGTVVDRYCSDITRTFYFGKPSAKDHAMYETVLRAQADAFDALGPGVRGQDVHAAAQRVIDASDFKGTFIHGLGHGLGLAVHDGGGLSPASSTVLEEGMVMTVEPGVYLNGYGGVRIEDDVVITKTGHRKLTTAAREFHVVG